MNRLLNISVATLILSLILLSYSIYLVLTTDNFMVRIISLLLIVYYSLVIPMEISLIGKKCYCE